MSLLLSFSYFNACFKQNNLCIVNRKKCITMKLVPNYFPIDPDFLKEKRFSMTLEKLAQLMVPIFVRWIRDSILTILVEGYSIRTISAKSFSHWLCCCHILTDKGNGRRMDRNNVKTVYPEMEVVSVAVNVDAEVVRSYTY